MTLSDFSRLAADIWSYQLAIIEGTPMTVGKVVLALALVAVGYVVSRRLSRSVGRVLIRRARLDPGAAAAVEMLGFYVFFVSFAVTALQLVRFPLNALAIAGGALAIGIGFGSQNIVNNFISGLILLVERPIRVNDLVRVEGSDGTVEHIGARSTKIRAADNTQIIVPNSFFLQNHVINYTLSDDIIRTQVTVGVVYGSSTREVARLMRRAIDEHPEILSAYEPRILFADFGDNALLFEAYFWVHGRSIMDRRRIESDVRYRIDELFREAELVIAYPQRDVHLDTSRPLDVRVLAARGEDVP
jgi:potassium efflux system protein